MLVPPSPFPTAAPPFLPGILGTSRRRRMSEAAANFLAAEIATRSGGARVIQNLLPVMRELRLGAILCAILWDVKLASVHDVFDDAAGLQGRCSPPTCSLQAVPLLS